MNKLILASGSPRRYSLLSGYGFDVTVIKPDFDESTVTESDPSALVLALAHGKAASVNAPKDTLLLAADTVVAIDGQVLGKPEDSLEAFEMLDRLSGRTHSVYTGVCIRKNESTELFYAKSDVTFYNLSNTQIEKYISTGSPLDKAGSYGIQDDMGIAFVRSVDGEISNVIGLPMEQVLINIRKIEGEDQ